MDSLSATAYVILGLLRKGPMSGYEIKAIVDKSVRFFWTASYGQIYPELKRLTEAGLVEGIDSPTGGRRRTVYEITAGGEEELVAWLRQPPDVFEMRDEGLLKLFFADALPPEEAVAIVRTMRERREAVNRTLRAMEPGKVEDEEDKDSYVLTVLRCGIEFSDWFVDWCERTEAQILAAAPTQRRS